MRSDDAEEAYRSAEGCNGAGHDTAAEQGSEMDFSCVCPSHLREIFSKQDYVKAPVPSDCNQTSDNECDSHNADV